MLNTEPGNRSFFSSILTYKLSFRNPPQCGLGATCSLDTGESEKVKRGGKEELGSASSRLDRQIRKTGAASSAPTNSGPCVRGFRRVGGGGRVAAGFHRGMSGGARGFPGAVGRGIPVLARAALGCA